MSAKSAAFSLRAVIFAARDALTSSSGEEATKTKTDVSNSSPSPFAA